MAAEPERGESRKRLEDIARIVRHIRAPNYLLFIVGEGVGPTPQAPQPVRKFIYEELRKLDYEVLRVRLAEEGLEAMPTLHYQHGETGLNFRVMPREPSKLSSLGGSFGGGMHLVDPMTAIKNAVLEKGSRSRYGELQHPLVIALDVDYWMLSDMMTEEGLYGSINARIYTTPTGQFTQWERTGQGAFTDTGRSASSRVAAALVFADPNPFRFHQAPVGLWPNPAVQTHLGVLERFPRHYRAEERRAPAGGVATAEVLGLPTGWPMCEVPPGADLRLTE